MALLRKMLYGTYQQGVFELQIEHHLTIRLLVGSSELEADVIDQLLDGP